VFEFIAGVWTIGYIIAFIVVFISRDFIGYGFGERLVCSIYFSPFWPVFVIYLAWKKITAPNCVQNNSNSGVSNISRIRRSSNQNVKIKAQTKKQHQEKSERERVRVQEKKRTEKQLNKKANERWLRGEWEYINKQRIQKQSQERQASDYEALIERKYKELL
jgi:hypothetical protein